MVPGVSVGRWLLSVVVKTSDSVGLPGDFFVEGGITESDEDPDVSEIVSIAGASECFSDLCKFSSVRSISVNVRL